MRKADLELGRRHSPILSPDPRPWLGTCANRHPGCPGKSPHSPGLSRIKTLDRAERPRRPSRRSFRSAGSGWRLRRITSWMLPARTRPSDWRRRRSRHFTPWTTETECSAVFAAAFRSRTTPRSSISSAWAAPFVSPHLIQIDSEDSASCTSPVDICGLSPGFHLGGHLKTGHRSTLQNRPPHTWRARRSEFYRRPSWERKSVCSLVRQLRGPHLSTCAWWRRRSRSAVTAAVSPRSFPQSSTGLFDVSSVDARS